MKNFKCPPNSELWAMRARPGQNTLVHKWYTWHVISTKVEVRIRTNPGWHNSWKMARRFVRNCFYSQCDPMYCHFIIRKATHADILAISELQAIRSSARHEKAGQAESRSIAVVKRARTRGSRVGEPPSSEDVAWLRNVLGPLRPGSL